MANSSESTQAQRSRIQELMARMAESKKARSKAAEAFRECAAQAAQDTPADSKLFFLNRGPAPIIKINGFHPDAAQIEERKRELIEQRKKRKAGLTRLKRTTYLAVQRLTPTEPLDPAELRRRLAIDEDGCPTSPLPGYITESDADSA